MRPSEDEALRGAFRQRYLTTTYPKERHFCVVLLRPAARLLFSAPHLRATSRERSHPAPDPVDDRDLDILLESSLSDTVVIVPAADGLQEAGIAFWRGGYRRDRPSRETPAGQAAVWSQTASFARRKAMQPGTCDALNPWSRSGPL